MRRSNAISRARCALVGLDVDAVVSEPVLPVWGFGLKVAIIPKRLVNLSIMFGNYHADDRDIQGQMTKRKIALKPPMNEM